MCVKSIEDLNVPTDKETFPIDLRITARNVDLSSDKILPASRNHLLLSPENKGNVSHLFPKRMSVKM